MHIRTSLLRRPVPLTALILAVIFSSVFSTHVKAKVDADVLPQLEAFIENVSDGTTGVLRGVYVPDVMAFPIIQQPDGFPNFVSPNQNQLTQFGMAANTGNVGLLAHNYLSGNLFSHLSPGNHVILVYGDGRTESFVVTSIKKYQALDPNNPHGGFLDFETQAQMNTAQVFDRMYRGQRHVTFQTCIEKDGNLSWGRLFVIAEPAENLIAPSGLVYTGSTFEELRKNR